MMRGRQQDSAVAEAGSTRLADRLREVFGHAAFRPHQEAICQAIVDGADALVVMPTGAGKSLCYQLPGLVRGGVTLVLSPLIALMEDQVAALCQRGLRAERIHSGRERSDSRRVCRAYLDGEVDFLFVAPERLRVPGFPELLARRPPSLVAIDEAHCISHWGHDFRPDYRRLGGLLTALRPAPVVALTATATPRVQDDIARDLGLCSPLRFVHGFRRENLAIEVVDATPATRPALVEASLEDPAHRPAIVYAPTRRKTEELAEILGTHFPTGAYHAGLPSAERDRIQAAFLRGELEVVVATIAFGMGIDKADVRTIVHTALPGSLEGYSQEIGRAGRDGAPARAILLTSRADRMILERFHEQNYPPPRLLARVRGALSTPRTREDLASGLAELDPEIVARALDQLVVHGGAQRLDYDLWGQAGEEWQETYRQQVEHSRAQLDVILHWADSPTCRMSGIVAHFGDHADARRACGSCDVCAADDTRIAEFRQPSDEELALLKALLGELRTGDRATSGQLHKRVAGRRPIERQQVEALIDGLVRAAFARSEPDELSKDGETIRFRWIACTREGATATMDDLRELALPTRRRAAKAAARRAPSRGRTGTQAPSGPVDQALAEALRSWRLEQARERKMPAYCIFPDRTLAAIAGARPTTLETLAAVPGIGPTILASSGPAILEIVKAAAGLGVAQE